MTERLGPLRGAHLLFVQGSGPLLFASCIPRLHLGKLGVFLIREGKGKIHPGQLGNGNPRLFSSGGRMSPKSLSGTCWRSCSCVDSSLCVSVVMSSASTSTNENIVLLVFELPPIALRF